MEQNHIAQGASAGAASDEHASLLPNRSAAAEAEPDDQCFATEAEEEAYWAGVADGIRKVGGIVPPRLAARAAGQQLLVAVHEDPLTAAADLPAQDQSADALDFTPTQLRHRDDGWTPRRQREFVEALADCGIVRQAAAKVGMSEQSLNRLRRRADAHGFDSACTAAQRIGARRLYSIAFERAIEGTVKRHFFRGELKAEERVYDNRLLIALINKLPDQYAPDPDADAVAADWERSMDAIEQGLPCPPPPPAPEPEPEPEPEPFEGQVWEDGDLLTNCPPPPGFDLYQDEEPGDPYYQRRLTPEEEEYWEEEGEEQAFEDLSFGGKFWSLGRATFFPWGSETTALSAPQGDSEEDDTGCEGRSADPGEAPPAAALGDGSAQAALPGGADQ